MPSSSRPLSSRSNLYRSLGAIQWRADSLGLIYNLVPPLKRREGGGWELETEAQHLMANAIAAFCGDETAHTILEGELLELKGSGGQQESPRHCRSSWKQSKLLTRIPPPCHAAVSVQTAHWVQSVSVFRLQSAGVSIFVSPPSAASSALCLLSSFLLLL